MSGSLLQTLLQPRSEATRTAELVHHPACVAELVRGQQGLQGPQVALQGLRQRRHGLRGHRGGETQLLPHGGLEGEEAALKKKK